MKHFFYTIILSLCYISLLSAMNEENIAKIDKDTGKIIVVNDILIGRDKKLSNEKFRVERYLVCNLLTNEYYFVKKATKKRKGKGKSNENITFSGELKKVENVERIGKKLAKSKWQETDLLYRAHKSTQTNDSGTEN